MVGMGVRKVVCLGTMAGTCTRQGNSTKALCYTSDSSKMNNEGCAEIGAALRHKEYPSKCLVFALALFMHHRFVTMMLFKWECGLFLVPSMLRGQSALSKPVTFGAHRIVMS